MKQGNWENPKLLTAPTRLLRLALLRLSLSIIVLATESHLRENPQVVRLTGNDLILFPLKGRWVIYPTLLYITLHGYY